MKNKFPATFYSSRDDFWRDACMTLCSAKEAHELRDAFDILLIWREYFESQFGDLEAIVHYSNPDDPPDAVAQFARGDLEIELTLVEPSHVMQANALGRTQGGKVRAKIPLSYIPRTKSEMLEIMANRSPSEGWERLSDNLEVRTQIIVTACEKKIRKHPSGGLLILQGEIQDDQFNRSMIQKAFDLVGALPGVEKWIIAIKYRMSRNICFSAMWTRETGVTFVG